MTKFEKLLEDWNNGVFRGAKVILARKIGVDDSTVSAWLNGHSKPAVDKIKKMSEILNISEKEVREMFNIKCKNSINNVNSNNNVKGNITQTVNSIDMELLKKDVEILKLQMELLKRDKKK